MVVMIVVFASSPDVKAVFASLYLSSSVFVSGSKKTSDIITDITAITITDMIIIFLFDKWFFVVYSCIM